MKAHTRQRPSSTDPSIPAQVAGVKAPPRILEFCCSENSRIGRDELRGDIVVDRLTETVNLCSANGLDYAKNMAKTRKAGRTLLWCSVPCTGGSALNLMNPARDKPSFIKKNREDRLLMKKLWTSFEVVAYHVLRTGGRVAIEWPANCLLV